MGITTSLALRTYRSNKKQKERFAITEITKQDFEKCLNKFYNTPYLGYNSKQFHNEPTEAYLSRIKNVNKTIKSNGHG